MNDTASRFCHAQTMAERSAYFENVLNRTAIKNDIERVT
jgi:hypothetical protein